MRSYIFSTIIPSFRNHSNADLLLSLYFQRLWKTIFFSVILGNQRNWFFIGTSIFWMEGQSKWNALWDISHTKLTQQMSVKFWTFILKL